MRSQGCDELAEIGSASWFFHVELAQQRGQDEAQMVMLLEELPQACADGIQTEVRAGQQVQQDHFARELLSEDVFRDGDAGIQRNFA